MNGDTPKLKEFARRLLAHNATDGKPAETKDAEKFRVCEKLRGPLSRLTGVGGFRSLLSRALALSGEEISWLRALHINEDGSLEGLEKLEVQPDSREIAEGEVVLVSQLLGLLLVFIGPALTVGLLHEIWPKVDLDI
jgi:nicotinic acid phosphoribosyltransferase